MTIKPYPRPIPNMEMVALLAAVSRPLASYHFSPNPDSANSVSESNALRLQQAADVLEYKPFGNEEWFQKMGKLNPHHKRHRS